MDLLARLGQDLGFSYTIQQVGGVGREGEVARCRTGAMGGR